MTQKFIIETYSFSGMFKKFSAMLFFLPLTFLTLYSQEYLTYEDVIRIAVDQNITIKQQKNNLKVSQSNKHQSMANYLPGVAANGGGSRTEGSQFSNTEGAIVNTSIDRANYNVTADLTVFNGFNNLYRLKQANQLHIAQKEQVEQSTQDVIFQASQQFLQLLLDKELLLIAEDDYELQKKVFDQLSVYVRTGTRTKTDLLSQEAQLKNSEVNLITRRNQLRYNKAKLSKTLFFEPNKEFNILSPTWGVDSLLAVELDIDSLIQLALDNRPNVKRLEAIKKASLQGMRVAKSSYMPSLGVYYSYGSSYLSTKHGNTAADTSYHRLTNAEQLLSENITNVYGFTVRIPIFSRLQTRNSVVRSKIAYENSELSYLDFEMQLFLDVQNACQNFHSYKESYLASVTSANASSNSYNKQLEMYRLGEGSLVDLNVEGQRNINAQSQKIQAEYTLLFQQVMLDYYVGVLSHF